MTLILVNSVIYMQDDSSQEIKRALYWCHANDSSKHDPLVDSSDDCLARQYEWSEEHESLGGGNFQRKNITGEDIDITL